MAAPQAGASIQLIAETPKSVQVIKDELAKTQPELSEDPGEWTIAEVRDYLTFMMARIQRALELAPEYDANAQIAGEMAQFLYDNCVGGFPLERVANYLRTCTDEGADAVANLPSALTRVQELLTNVTVSATRTESQVLDYIGEPDDEEDEDEESDDESDEDDTEAD